MGIGLVVGVSIGAAVGFALGSIIFKVGAPGMWGAIVAGVVFGALGGSWAGMSALGPPAQSTTLCLGKRETKRERIRTAARPDTTRRYASRCKRSIIATNGRVFCMT